MEERRKIKSRIIFLFFYCFDCGGGRALEGLERNAGNGESAFAGPEGMRDSIMTN